MREAPAQLGFEALEPAALTRRLAAVDLSDALSELFGFPAFRTGQREACEAALAGRDALVVMPTGSGKSLCYQLPGLLREDLTVVVSPLVALMQDQVEALRARGLGEQVALVNSQRDAAENRRSLERAKDGSLRLLYVAPERFSSPPFIAAMADADVGLFVVDEAHCVSQWGHDFRPDYFRLADAARHLKARSIMASTATATPQVAADVVARLGLREPVRVTTGFDRPNLSFTVARPTGDGKRRMLTETLRAPDALPAIVYAGTRAGTEETAADLRAELGEEVLAYHAGLDRERRALVQRRFLGNEVRVVVATNAFGMGVDKPNVRTVVHTATPSSLEAYYQEAGRGGRDGAPASALLLAENRDKALHVHFIKRDELDEGLPGRLAERLAAAADAEGRYRLEAGELASAIGVHGDGLRALVGHLARAGVLSPLPSAPSDVAGRLVGPYDRAAAGRAQSSMADGGRARWRQYREIWAYVEEGRCRRRAVLDHFGDASAARAEGPCCDVCDPSLVPELPAVDPAVVADLDEAIVSVVRDVRPSVGRTTCAEILHGARTKKIERNSWNGLPAYAWGSRLRRADILTRIDELIESGRLGTTDGPYPVLAAPSAPAPA